MTRNCCPLIFSIPAIIHNPLWRRAFLVSSLRLCCKIALLGTIKLTPLQERRENTTTIITDVSRVFELTTPFPPQTSLSPKGRSNPSVFITTLRTFSTSSRVNPSGKSYQRCVKPQSTNWVYAICDQSCSGKLTNESSLLRSSVFAIFVSLLERNDGLSCGWLP